MSRKLRVPKGRTEALPSAAWTFALLTGTPASVRIRGWVKQGQGGLHGQPTAEEVWAQYGEALTALADAHGFEPYALTQIAPTGAGYEAWRRAFLMAHEY